MPEELGGGGGYDAGTVFIGIDGDPTPLFSKIDAIATKANRIPTVRVDFDHGPLTAGNKHIESKVPHALDVNRRLAQNPITPKYDGSQLTRLTADLRAVQGQVDSLRQQRIQLEATLNADSVKAQLDAIANQPRTIYYAAVVQMPDVQAIQGSIQAELKATIDPSALRSAAPDIGKEIAEQIAKAKVDVNQGGVLSRIAFSGISSVFRGFQESVGKEIFKGVSDTRKQSLQGVGGVVDRVTSAAGGAVRDTALKGAGFADVKDFQQAFKNFKLENLFLEPIQKASSIARAAAVQAKVEGESAAKAYFNVFRTTLVSEVKSSKDIKDAGIGAAGRVVAGAVNVAAPVQSFRRDVAIGKAQKQAESIDVELTPQEIESILRAKKQIILGNAGYYNFEKGNSGNIVGAPTQRYLGQEFVGIENPSATKFLRGEALPPNLKAVIDEEKTLSFFRGLAKSAQKLGVEVPKELANIADGSELEAVLLKTLKGQNEEFRRVYLSAIESIFGGGINADLPQQIAKIKAIQKLRPDLDVKAIGFSGGGYYVDQLARATGIKAATLGTPFFQPSKAISGRGTEDPQFDVYGKNAFLRNNRSLQFQDLEGAGALHSPASYFGKQNVRSFLNKSLDLGLSSQQIETQGVDPRQLQNADKNIRKTVSALVKIAESASYLEDISSVVGSYDFKGLSPDEVTPIFLISPWGIAI